MKKNRRPQAQKVSDQRRSKMAQVAAAEAAFQALLAEFEPQSA